MEILHFSHEHPLKLDRIDDDKGETCNGCTKTICSVGYACLECGFLLHKKCAKLPHVIQTSLHPQHPLTFHPEASNSSETFKCSACEKNCSGFLFQCKDCSYNIDANCIFKTQLYLNLPLKENTRKLEHFCHNHALTLNYIAAGSEVSCKACEQPISGPAYTCKECTNFSLHKSCALLPREMQHPFHHLHPLTLLTQSPYASGIILCDACYKRLRGFVFHCATCKFDLDLTCASVMPSLKHEKHDHLLAFFEETKLDVYCTCCQKKCSDRLYRCVGCNFNVHASCLQFPKTSKHKYHPHALNFKGSDVGDDQSQYFCDSCKRKINPGHPTYFCAECNYGLHVECIVPEDETTTNTIPKKLPEDVALLHAEAETLATGIKEEIGAVSTKLQMLSKSFSSMLDLQSKLKERVQSTEQS